jgi:hypothetical protein
MNYHNNNNNTTKHIGLIIMLLHLFIESDSSQKLFDCINHVWCFNFV